MLWRAERERAASAPARGVTTNRAPPGHSCRVRATRWHDAAGTGLRQRRGPQRDRPRRRRIPKDNGEVVPYYADARAWAAAKSV
jgi:hypothetical protein